MNVEQFMARLRQKEAAPPWTAILGLGLVVAYFVARIVSLALVSLLVDIDAAANGVISPLTTNYASILAALVALGIAWRAVSRRDAQPMTALQLRHFSGSILLLVLFSLGMAILVDFVPLILNTVGLPVAMVGLANAASATWVLAAIFAIVVGPVVEMLILQGVLYPALAVNRDNGRAVLLTALMYTVLQVMDNPSDPALWGASFLGGVYLSSVRAHQKSTRAAIIAASMFGLFALFKAMRLFW
jgi:membrane protease YdiL (CAAX protease family)